MVKVSKLILGSCRLDIELPYPVSVNQYYTERCFGNRVMKFVSSRGKVYQKETKELLKPHKELFREDERIYMYVSIIPPTKRKSDVDNLGKCLLDSLENAQVFSDDSQIDQLTFVRSMNNVSAPGAVIVKLYHVLGVEYEDGLSEFY